MNQATIPEMTKTTGIQKTLVLKSKTMVYATTMPRAINANQIRCCTSRRLCALRTASSVKSYVSNVGLTGVLDIDLLASARLATIRASPMILMRVLTRATMFLTAASVIPKRSAITSGPTLGSCTVASNTSATSGLTPWSAA